MAKKTKQKIKKLYPYEFLLESTIITDDLKTKSANIKIHNWLTYWKIGHMFVLKNEISEWLDSNTSGYKYHDGVIYFKNEKDLMFFKLTWSNRKLK